MPKQKTIAEMYDPVSENVTMDEYDIHYQISVPDWLRLPAEVRGLFIEQFNIPRSTGTLVEDGRVVSDGHNTADLSIINVRTLQEYLGIKEKDFSKLVKLTAKKLEEHAE